MKVKEIFDFLNNLYPIETACDFDNVGLLVGSPENEVKKVLVALDLNTETLNYALKMGCDTIVTHHPVIFSPLKKVLSGSIVFELIKNDISVISMHTNLDIAENGVSEELCKVLRLEEISSFTASDGFTLKSGTISPINADAFAEIIKSKLGGNIKYTDGGKAIEKVLVCSGSGGEFIFDAINNGYDAFISSEIKHHQFLAAIDNNISVFDAGHFGTEDIIVEPLKNTLSEKFNNIKFFTFHSNKIKQI